MDNILSGRINIPLTASEALALRSLAESEHRQPQEQARFIIYRELVKRGLLPKNAIKSNQAQSSQEGISRE